MNVLFLFVSLPHLSNDTEMFPSLIHEFARHGHKVMVSSKGKNVSETRVEEESGIPVLRIKCRDFTGVTNNVKKALAYQEYVLKQRHNVLKFWGK